MVKHGVGPLFPRKRDEGELLGGGDTGDIEALTHRHTHTYTTHTNSEMCARA